jgi:hypothetical protein
MELNVVAGSVAEKKLWGDDNCGSRRDPDESEPRAIVVVHLVVENVAQAAGAVRPNLVAHVSVAEDTE